MKKHLTSSGSSRAVITINTANSAKRFAVPVSVIKHLQQELAEYEISFGAEERLPWRSVLSDLVAQGPEPAVMLRASRKKAGLTQCVLAEKLGISQSNLAAMESGRRSIGKTMAKRLAAVFKSDYRLFI